MVRGHHLQLGYHGDAQGDRPELSGARGGVRQHRQVRRRRGDAPAPDRQHLFELRDCGGVSDALERRDLLHVAEVLRTGRGGILAAEPIGMAFFAPATMVRTMESPGFEAAVRGRPASKLCAGAPLGADQKRRILKTWPGPLFDLYGQAETGTLTILSAHAAPAEKLGSVGTLLPTASVQILDEEGRVLPPDAEGEIADTPRHSCRAITAEPSRRGGDLARCVRPPFHPDRRCRPARRRRLSLALRPEEGPDHFRWLQYLSGRHRAGAAGTPGGARGGRGRVSVRSLGGDTGGVRGRCETALRRRRTAFGTG